jgi:hypothetical protein
MKFIPINLNDASHLWSIFKLKQARAYQSKVLFVYDALLFPQKFKAFILEVNSDKMLQTVKGNCYE